jgi:hypothetical protein
MIKNLLIVTVLLSTFIFHAKGQNISINVRVKEERKAISPYLYGRNNNFSNVFGSPTTARDIKLYKEAGLKFARENNGNNATKYNWKRKISSHPDWYNNVYDHDWDLVCKTVSENLPDVQTMFAFQLIGQVADNKDNNFNDWGYNQAKWWEGTAQNLAGGGIMKSTGTKAATEGDPSKYLVNWNADSTTDILNHWFGEGGMGFDKTKFQYWSMDNEPEIWSGTHDDIMPSQIPAADFMTNYFAVAKLARQKFPEIKLAAPITANEWQWYKYANENLKIDGQYYCWLEYFLKSVADEQKRSGVRLLDMVDIHWYPTESNAEQAVQSHRIFFDENYEYPGANGLKTISGSWDGTKNKEYIFKRINDWLTQYFGADHGITLGLSEFGSGTSDPDVNSVLYGSMIGTFANNGVELFTPWTWQTGMWETLHLYSRYSRTTKVKATSTDETKVSSYTSINASEDSLTLMLVNRDVNASQKITVKLNEFVVSSASYSLYELSDLPNTETFISHINNALKVKKMTISGNTFTITLPPLSTTAVLLKGEIDGEITLGSNEALETEDFTLFPNPSNGVFQLTMAQDDLSESEVTIYDLAGSKQAQYHWSHNINPVFTANATYLPAGVYTINVTNSKFSKSRTLVVKAN